MRDNLKRRFYLEETQKLRGRLSPNLYPSGLDSFICSGHPARAHLKKNRGLEPGQNPNLAPVLSGRVQLVQSSMAWKAQSISKNPRASQTGPFVQDWRHPVRAPSEENWRPQASPKPKPGTRLVWTGGSKASRHGSINKHRPSPNLAPTNQVHLFRIGGI